MMELDLQEELAEFMAAREAELIAFRRDLHAHPETGYREYRTTRRVLERLALAGLRPLMLPKGTGLVVDVGDGPAGGLTGLIGPGQEGCGLAGPASRLAALPTPCPGDNAAVFRRGPGGRA